MSVLTFPHLKRIAVERPITTLCVVAIGLTLPLQTALLLAGIDLFIGKLAELVFLTGTAALITSRIGGRGAVRRLFQCPASGPNPPLRQAADCRSFATSSVFCWSTPRAACSQQRCCTHPSMPPAPCPWCRTAGSTCQR
jgi:hypothetical protein